MSKSDYTYQIYDDRVEIIDLNLGRMSVTNDAEAVLTEINAVEHFRGKTVIARDSYGEWSRIVPEWNRNNECVDVYFTTVNIV